MQKMIDIVIPTAQKGGVENVINMLAMHLLKNDFRVRVVQFVWEKYCWLSEEIEFYPMREGLGNYTSDEFVSDYENFLQENGVPDLIVATNWPLMPYIIRNATARLNVHIPILSWVHNEIERYEANGFGGVEYMQYADAHLAINSKIKDTILSRFPDEIVFDVKNPVDLDKLQKYQLNHKNLNFKLIFVGRLSAVKRVEIIVRAMTNTKKEWTLDIVGEGELHDYIKSIVVECGVEDRIHWVGWESEPWKHASDKSFLVMPSAFEGFPLTAIEANACGLPVIATPVSGVRCLIEPGVNGYLIPFDDSGALTKVLDYISDEKLPYLEPKACIEKSKMYDKNIVLDEYVEIFRKLI